MTYRILSIAIMLSIGINASAQQTDPALVGAVGVQTAMLKDIFSDREKTQQKIIAAEAAVTVAMDRMHQVENKMLDYLSNAQGAMQNLYQIKRAAELVTTEIPQNMNLVRKSVPGHLKGTAIALLVSDELTDAATQMASLFPFMKQLVTSGTYNVDGYDSQGNPTTEKHKVNLLNSAERYYVANQYRPLAAGMADQDTVLARPVVWTGPRRLGGCNVRKGHSRKPHLRMGIPVEKL